MSPASNIEAESLDDAVAAAIAELAGVAPADVRVTVDGPGVDDLTGPFHVELRTSEAPGAAEPDPEEPEALDVPEEASQRPTEPDGSSEGSEAPEEAAVPPRAETDGSGGSRPVGRFADDDELPDPDELDQEAEAAADFVEGLLDAFDIPGDLRIRIRETHAEVEIAELEGGTLIGRRGQTLDAVQELVRCSLQRQFQRRARVLIDAEGYRERRLEKMVDKAREAIETVLESGEPVRLEPMDVFERKSVHHLVAETDGVVSHSHGREPGRRVVIEQE